MGKFYRCYAEDLFEILKQEKYKSYLETGGMPVPTAVWTDGDIYIVEEGNVLSVLTLTGKANLFKCKKFVDVYLDLFGKCEFNYDLRNRNSIFIERLVDKMENVRVISRMWDNNIKITEMIRGNGKNG